MFEKSLENNISYYLFLAMFFPDFSQSIYGSFESLTLKYSMDSQKGIIYSTCIFGWDMAWIQYEQRFSNPLSHLRKTTFRSQWFRKFPPKSFSTNSKKGRSFHPQLGRKRTHSKTGFSLFKGNNQNGSTIPIFFILFTPSLFKIKKPSHLIIGNSAF